MDFYKAKWHNSYSYRILVIQFCFTGFQIICLYCFLKYFFYVEFSEHFSPTNMHRSCPVGLQMSYKYICFEYNDVIMQFYSNNLQYFKY